MRVCVYLDLVLSPFAVYFITFDKEKENGGRVDDNLAATMSTAEGGNETL